MKILFVSNLYPPNVLGGYERLCFEVATELSQRGHDVVVLTSNFGHDGSYPGQRIIRSLTLLVGESIYEPIESGARAEEISRANRRTLSSVVLAEAPDVIFAWNLYFFDAPFLETLLNTASAPVVFELTDNWMLTFYNPQFWSRYYDRIAGGRPERLVERLKFLQPSKHLSQHAIFSSMFMRSLYAQAGLYFADSRVIYHGVQPLKGGVDATPSIGATLQLLFAGRVVHVKGVHTLVDAMPSLIASHPHLSVSLTILGDTQDTKYVESLREQIHHSGLADTIRFAPPVDLSQLARVFASHNLFVFPSLYEPFSLTLIHAMQAGMPIVASDAGGTPEVIKHGQTGWLYPAGNSRRLTQVVSKAVRNQSACTRVAANAQTVGMQYTFDRMIGEIERYLEEVMVR